MTKKAGYRVSENRPVHRVADPDLITNVIETTKLKYGIPTDYFKVFAIGFNKTATTSMSKLFEQAGLTVMDGPHWRKASKWHILEQFQAFTDGPPDDFAALDRTYPRSKFILNVRNLDEWMDSRMEHIKFRMSEGTHKARGDWRLAPGAFQSWVRKREEHHRAVLRHFDGRPDDLLVVNFIKDPAASQKLADFIGFEKGGEIPYERSTPKTREPGQLTNADAIADCLNALGIPPRDWSNDILCPSLPEAAGAPTDDLSRFPVDTSAIR